MCCACFCHGGLLSDIDGSIGGEETVIVGLGRLGLGWWGGWAGGEAGLVGLVMVGRIGELRFLFKLIAYFFLPLAMRCVKTHILFSTTVLLHAASFAVFCGGWAVL
ncbi:hypothetical protein [Bartonella sp. CL435QHHD]|uniref:hypothetical protein n=1 Tax=Bartonella sp. CL435QHHD TaxID=3243530 RepID=UPI0035CFCA54